MVATYRPAILPFITAGELLFGAKHSRNRASNLHVYLEFLAGFAILYPDRETLEAYSDLRLALRLRGRPLPHNDAWQAALALQRDAVLVTNDAHFSFVPGLRVEDWLA